MTQPQKIYGRWEYNLGDTTLDELFDFYRQNRIFNKNGIQIGGICTAKNVNRNTAIIMTYDKESELMLILKFSGINGVSHNSFY